LINNALEVNTEMKLVISGSWYAMFFSRLWWCGNSF